MPDYCPVFCTANIPTTMLDFLLECTEECVSKFGFGSSSHTAQASDYLVIMDTKDIAPITKGSSPPITSCPTAFLSHSLKEVQDWFNVNITQPRPKGFMPYCFLVLDNKSVDDGTCVFVCTRDSAPGEIHSLRCVFELAFQNATACNFQRRSIEDNGNGCWMRSGVTMTEANLKLVDNGGLYIEDGEVKLSQAWRDFRNW